MNQSKRKPKVISKEEARYVFLKHVAGLVTYWENESGQDGIRDKLEGLAFSVLSMLDGCSGGAPGYLVVPNGTQEDVDYSEEIGVDWYSVPVDGVVECDIGGSLHEEISSYFRGEVSRPENLYDFGQYLVDEAKKYHRLGSY